MEVTVYLGIGSNIEPRKEYIFRAMRILAENSRIREKGRSSLYRTRPFGVSDQGEFLNLVLQVQTDLPPEELFTVIKNAERQAGRIERQRWGAREVDIDILLYGDQVYHSEVLDIPHKGLMSRDFFVVPLLVLMPDAVNPETGQKLSDLDFTGENRYVTGVYEPEEKSV